MAERIVKSGESTRYELALVRGDERILIRYTYARALRNVLGAMSDHADRIVKLTGAEKWDFINPKRRADGLKLGEWTLRFTGRTQREAYAAPLPFIVERVEIVEPETATS